MRIEEFVIISPIFLPSFALGAIAAIPIMSMRFDFRWFASLTFWAK